MGLGAIPNKARQAGRYKHRPPQMWLGTLQIYGMQQGQVALRRSRVTTPYKLLQHLLIICKVSPRRDEGIPPYGRFHRFTP